MSNELFNLALKSDIDSASQIAVMMVLANAADDEGVCWPSVDHLMAATRLSRSTVLRALSDLENNGYVAKQRRRAKSSVYTVVRERLQNGKCHGETCHGDTLSEPNVSQRDLLRSHSDTVLKGITKRITKSSATPADDTNEHPEARNLCERLAELMAGNGCKPQTIGKRWLDAARLLLDRDERPFTEALAVLEWCQGDDFEQVNIHSMPKFRARYDQLRMKAQRAGALTPKTTAPSTPDAIRVWLRQQWQDAATGPIERITGLRYEQPDVPLEVNGRDAIEEFFHTNRRDWITRNHEAIIARLSKDTAA